MTQMVTYQSGPRKSDLRSVLVDEVRQTTLLLPTGSLDVVQAKLLHGRACRHEWWAEQLGTDPASDDFVAPAEVIRSIREMNVTVKTGAHK
jgi:hypothetical protein